jgi:hypothetical protein
MAFVAKEPFDQFGHGTPVINVVLRQVKGQQPTLAIDHQVQLEAVEPAEGDLNGSLWTGEMSGLALR